MAEDSSGSGGHNPEENSGELVAQIRDEMNQQFSALKQSFEAQLAELKAANEKLMKDNDGLKAALVRSAMTDPPREEPKEETQEEKDEKTRQHAIERTKELLMKHYKE